MHDYYRLREATEMSFFCSKCINTALAHFIDRQHIVCAQRWFEYGVCVNGKKDFGQEAIVHACKH